MLPGFDHLVEDHEDLMPRINESMVNGTASRTFMIIYDRVRPGINPDSSCSYLGGGLNGPRELEPRAAFYYGVWYYLYLSDVVPRPFPAGFLHHNVPRG